MGHYIIMGVSGVGKSLIGQKLAERLGLPMVEGDDFHPESNIAKMSLGIPLTDEDRQGWLWDLACHINESGKPVICTCSALKQSYRDYLYGKVVGDIQFIYLKGDYNLILERMKAREDHFMPSQLLESQFDILEEPENAFTIPVNQSPGDIVDAIIKSLDRDSGEKTKIEVMKKEFGIIGLGVMGKSLARNVASRGIRLALFNRHVAGKEEDVAEQFISEFNELSKSSGFENLELFIAGLEHPRKILIMVKAGGALDSIIEELTPLLEKGDTIIDGGNSHYQNTERRQAQLEAHGIHYIGCGVSGGEEGALKGPSIMPGGDHQAYQLIAPFLEKIAARDKHGDACCTYIGRGGAGHFVKMVHNGIEYGEMQLLAEVYSVMRFGLRLNPDMISSYMEEWNQGPLNSYLLEITAQILKRREGEEWLVDLILDKAGNKGTGSWTTKTATELGVSISVLTSALFARYISAFKNERVAAQKHYGFDNSSRMTQVSVDQIRNAYSAARIINHHQGFHLIHEASEVYNWELNLSELARIWTNGCIIRSALMQELVEILKINKSLLDSQLRNAVFENADDLKHISAHAILAQHSVPCFSAVCNYLFAYTNQQSTANIIQAQRDFFGAHRYLRNDDQEGPSHHTEWLA